MLCRLSHAARRDSSRDSSVRLKAAFGRRLIWGRSETSHSRGVAPPLQQSEVIPHRNSCVSWECFSRSQLTATLHWFAVFALPSGLTLNRRRNVKPDLDPLRHLFLGMSLSLTSVSLRDSSSPLQWASEHLNQPAHYLSLKGPSPAAMRELNARIFRLKPSLHAEPLAICHMA